MSACEDGIVRGAQEGLTFKSIAPERTCAQRYTHTCTHKHRLSVTSTKAGMSQSSLERISGLGLCVHVALSASLFTFVSIHIKAFFFLPFFCLAR